MAKSRFEYIKRFELSDSLLPETWLVVRVDGRGFGRFTAEHGFRKPNDDAGTRLMTEAARGVLREWQEIVLAYGHSDEYSFLLPPSALLYNRRAAKIGSCFASVFTANYIFHWARHFPETPLLRPPSFDARVVAYPTARHVRDYFSWRQVDAHINCLYNACFWALVARGGETAGAAEEKLRGTVSSEKQELLFSRFGINYNNLPASERRGNVLVRRPPPLSQRAAARLRRQQQKQQKEEQQKARQPNSAGDILAAEFGNGSNSCESAVNGTSPLASTSATAATTTAAVVTTAAAADTTTAAATNATTAAAGAGACNGGVSATTAAAADATIAAGAAANNGGGSAANDGGADPNGVDADSEETSGRLAREQDTALNGEERENIPQQEPEPELAGLLEVEPQDTGSKSPQLEAQDTEDTEFEEVSVDIIKDRFWDERPFLLGAG